MKLGSIKFNCELPVSAIIAYGVVQLAVNVATWALSYEEEEGEYSESKIGFKAPEEKKQEETGKK